MKSTFNNTKCAWRYIQKDRHWGGRSEADLGMFSMFGRTEAHRKGAPTKAQKNIFCNMVTSQKYWNNDYGIKETIMRDHKLPDSCCCNSSVHCSTGPQQNVDDDYCACRVKAVGEYSYNRGPHIFFWTGARLGVNPALHIALRFHENLV